MTFNPNDKYVSVNRDIYHDSAVDDLKVMIELAKRMVVQLKHFTESSERRVVDQIYNHLREAEYDLELFPTYTIKQY